MAFTSAGPETQKKCIAWCHEYVSYLRTPVPWLSQALVAAPRAEDHSRKLHTKMRSDTSAILHDLFDRRM